MDLLSHEPSCPSPSHLTLESLPLEILSKILQLSGNAFQASLVSHKLRVAAKLCHLSLTFSSSPLPPSSCSDSPLNVAVFGLNSWKTAASRVIWPFSFTLPLNDLHLLRSLTLSSRSVIHCNFLLPSPPSPPPVPSAGSLPSCSCPHHPQVHAPLSHPHSLCPEDSSSSSPSPPPSPPPSPSLTSLDSLASPSLASSLSFPSPSPSTFHSFASLTDIDFSGTSMMDISGLAFCEHLQTVDLSSCPITDLSPLAGKRKLHRLLLSSTRVTDLSPLSGLPCLSHLCLCSTRITDLTPLRLCPTLHVVCLNNLRSLTSLAGLEGCPLHRLRIAGTAVSSLAPLRHQADIIELDISRTPLTDLWEVFPALPALSRLVDLSLAHLHGPALGGEPLFFLSYCRNLVAADLSAGELGDGSCLEACPSLRNLTVDHAQLTSLSFLSSTRRLRSLSMAHVQGVIDFSPLAHIPLLETLDVSATHFADPSLLLGCQRLTTFKAFGAHLVDASPLSQLLNLRFVNVSHNDIVSLDFLLALPSIEGVHACSTKITSLPPLCSPTLHHLCISSTEVSSIQPLRFCSALRSLNLTNTSIESLEVVRHFQELDDLAVMHSRVRSLEPLRHLPLLADLSLSGCPIEDLEPLVTLGALRQLAIVGCPIQDISMLRDCGSLTKVSLDARFEDHPIVAVTTGCAFQFVNE